MTAALAAALAAAETAQNAPVEELPAWVAVPVFLGLLVVLWWQWGTRK